MILGTKPSAHVLELAKKYKIPTTKLMWGRGTREWRKERFLMTIINREIAKRSKK
jgi:hypothetical protein